MPQVEWIVIPVPAWVKRGAQSISMSRVLVWLHVRIALTAYMPARTLHDRVGVGAVGGASSRDIRSQLRARSISEPLRATLVAAGSMGERHADLRQPLPKVPFVDRPSLPARF